VITSVAQVPAITRSSARIDDLGSEGYKFNAEDTTGRDYFPYLSPADRAQLMEENESVAWFENLERTDEPHGASDQRRR
jgi:hypothetical protein